MMHDAADKRVCGWRQAEFVLGVEKEVLPTRFIPQRHVGMAAIAGEMHKRFRHECGA